MSHKFARESNERQALALLLNEHGFRMKVETNLTDQKRPNHTLTELPISGFGSIMDPEPSIAVEHKGNQKKTRKFPYSYLENSKSVNISS